jgi:hypothetical protein
MQLSFNQRRIAVGLALLLCLLFTSNYLIDPGFLPQIKKRLMVIAFVVLAIAIFFVGPTIDEMHQHRKLQRRGRQ